LSLQGTSNFTLQIVGIISVFFICVSIVSFCLKTHPDMRVPAIRNITVKTADGKVAWTLDKEQTSAHEFFFYIECVCNAWFTFEILVRLLPTFIFKLAHKKVIREERRRQNRSISLQQLFLSHPNNNENIINATSYSIRLN
jgi:Ion transport protein